MSFIQVPPLGESIVEATVSRWLKKEGDPVAAGDTLVELETDKITVEVPALAISSTDIRARVRARRPIRYLTPEPVGSYIEKRTLYREAG